jgi:16S rRNA processing protein RimM
VAFASTWSIPIAEPSVSIPVDLVVGRVARPHGVRGELLVDVHTDEPSQRFAAGAALAATLRSGERRTVTVAVARPHGARLLVRFDAVADREAAEAMRGALLTVDSATLPPPSDPDEFYDHQLEGLSAVLADGTVVGTVTEVVHGGGTELLAISREDGAEALVPFVRAIVPTVDLEAGRIVLTPPEGLLES